MRVLLAHEARQAVRVLSKGNYNVLVLAQHLDDCAETCLMSLFHNGTLRSARQLHERAGDVRIIRPLIYTRERLCKEFSVKARLPVINENCPACFESPKERARVKKVLSQQESLWPCLYSNIRNGIRPLMNDALQKLLHSESAFRKSLHIQPRKGANGKNAPSESVTPSPPTSTIPSTGEREGYSYAMAQERSSTRKGVRRRDGDGEVDSSNSKKKPRL